MAFFPLLGGQQMAAAPTTAGLLGVDEDEFKRAKIAAMLSGLGAGLLGGKTWGEGLGAGTQMAMQGTMQARENVMRDAALRRQIEQENLERERTAKQLEAVTKAAGGLPEDQRDFALAFPDIFAKSRAAELSPDQDDATKRTAANQLFRLMGLDDRFLVGGGDNSGDATLTAPGRTSALPIPSIGTESLPPADMIVSDAPDGPRPYRAKLAGFESAGGTKLDNPQSSAAGRYQFMPDTITDLGYDASTINDPKVQEEALTKFLGSNAAAFEKGFGRAPNDAEQYAMHRFGAQGAAALFNADPSTPIEQIIGDEAAVVNPDVRGKTAGQVVRLMQQRMGTGSSWQTATGPTAQPPASGGQPPEAGGGINIDNLSARDAAMLNMLATQAGMGSPFKAGAAPETHGNVQYMGRDAQGRPIWEPIQGYAQGGQQGLVQGPEGPTVLLSRAGTTDVEKRRINAGEQLARLENINALYKPEYQTIGTRAATQWSSLKSKLGGDLAPEEVTKLREFKQYSRRGLENLNSTIKEITGAAMTEGEAERIKGQLPDPGTGIFDGDDPVSFKAKLDDAVTTTRMAIARYNYMLTHGIDVGSADDAANFKSLDAMPDFIDEVGVQIEAEVRSANPNADQDLVDAEVKARLETEFGL